MMLQSRTCKVQPGHARVSSASSCGSLPLLVLLLDGLHMKHSRMISAAQMPSPGGHAGQMTVPFL